MIDTAVILAGGKGTRLQSVSKGKPKPLVDVKGKPFLQWQIEFLKAQNIRNIILLVAYEAEQIVRYFKDNPIEGVSLSFVNEVQPMGTGGALRNSLPHLPEQFFVVNGDSFLPIELKPLVQQFEKNAADLLIVVLDPCHGVPVPANVRHSDGKITLYKKDASPSEGLKAVDAGLYILKKDVLLEPILDSHYDLSVYLQKAIARKRALAYPTQQIFFDIGTPDRLTFFEERLHDYFEDTI